ncbi:MAG: hypothetical protein Q7N50_13335 [Armatimonadota bacterium]|nr:hypothetical protein [Armatimonadota bacterium]
MIAFRQTIIVISSGAGVSDLNGAQRNGNPETSRVCIGISATFKSRYTTSFGMTE